MAAVIHLVLALLTAIGSLASPAPPTTSPAYPRDPHFTSCVSREMETFHCWWSAGSFQNLSEPGALRVFFMTKTMSPQEWRECPQYSWSPPSACFFNKTHTSIWTPYCLQLVSRDRGATYDETCFTVENIVRPDPPVGLNWTLLNVSQTALHFDAVLHWSPPASADVEKGWMSLQYEVQYRERIAPQWHTLSWEKSLYHSLYGLQVDTEYEARVRCKMFAFDGAGEFSEPVLISIPKIPSKESRIPVVVLLIFGTVGAGVLLLVIIYSQQQRLMVIFLPPVPGPKIKGIDPELLKKGNIEQLNILNNQLLYKPGVAVEDPWAEHIELDFDESGQGEGHWDTQSLLGTAPPARYDPPIRDDDSGRASCCEPDLSDPPDSPRPRPLYSQVGEVTQGGVVVLASSPEGYRGVKGKEEEEAGMRKTKLALVVGGYTSESDAQQLPPHPSPTLDYTLVTDVNQSSLLLNLTKPLPLTATPQSGPAPSKPLPLPAGYLSPDQLPSITL